MRHEVLNLDSFFLLLKADHLFGKGKVSAVDVEGHVTVFHLSHVLLLLLVLKTLDVVGDEFGVFLELFGNLGLGDLSVNEVDRLFLLELPPGDQFHFTGLGMSLDVEARPVGVTGYLDPAITGLNFGIPTVIGIVSHLI